MRNLIHILVALSLVLALASPACKFVSGQMIEICAADGTLKTIMVSPNQAPPSPETPAAPMDKKSSCDFCLLQSHFKGIGTAAAQILLYFILISTITAAWIARRYRCFELTSLSLRGPPLPV